MAKRTAPRPQRAGGLRRLLGASLLVIVGILVAFPLFSLTYFAMVRTSTPGFCASCHEIRPAYDAWKTSTHVNNAHGFVADCMDCHLPPPQDTFQFFYAKTFHGIKDVVAHFVGGPYDRAENRRKAHESMGNANCQKCHRNLLHIPNKRGAMLAHRDVLYARPGFEKRCVDCHRNLVHTPRDRYRYKQYEPPYIGHGV